jgi:RNA polymerase sigma-70 factor (ECF subfamily)
MPIPPDLLTRLLVREHDKLAAYTWQMVRDYHLVSEVLQEMALVATRKAGEIADERHFPAWARCTCRNLALDTLRQRQRRPALLSNNVLDLLEVEWSQFDEVDSFSLTAALRDCLKRLSNRARQIVDLRYGSGLSSARVAEHLGRKVTTVYVALTRIHRTLGECIRKKQAEEAAADA